LIALPAAVYFSFVLRLDSVNFEQYQPTCLALMAAALITIPIFWRAGIYARYWPFASIDELLLLAGTLAIALIPFTLLAWIGLNSLNIITAPRSIP
jgi:FlaA1/EpsC-like NDP-sugar epimerase